MAAVECAVERFVEELTLFLVERFHLREPADVVLQPLQDQVKDMDRKDRRRVEDRIVLHVRPIVEHRRQVLGDAFQEIVADDTDRHARDAGVLLAQA